MTDFRILKKWTDDDGSERCEYEASFWEGPDRPGRTGRRVVRKCADMVVGNGSGRKLLNTSPGVSYFPALRKAMRI